MRQETKDKFYNRRIGKRERNSTYLFLLLALMVLSFYPPIVAIENILQGQAGFQPSILNLWDEICDVNLRGIYTDTPR